MIISASRRTDIPAFFGDWFMMRIEQGYFHRINPFNTKQVRRFSLLPDDLDAIVFWTKNPKPFLKHLNQLDGLGYRYYFQHTLNDYPEHFEPAMPSLSSRIETFKILSERLGPERVIWRFDPIIISSVTPMEYHLEKISYIAGKLKGYSGRLVISFLDFYGKVQTRLKALQNKYHLTFTDMTDPQFADELGFMAKEIKQIADHNKFQVVTCAEAVDLDRFGIEHGMCIDAGLIQSIFGMNIKYKKDKNQRDECLCTESVDMGAYNTCRFNCTYCYAVQSSQSVANTLKKHRPDSASLIIENK
ncbi:DUF1848 domain-containing protein [Microaerobacter geothermalis]|uniref:DUF1848 domain-containing protein n=1 Tax=Microaerobacter geothermalis TaxID=674972 RepID=UPI001F3AD6FF|nr:DUF1848 domain-containing protein [Microaerobacter geothermalis]MCF6094772.1 DUF1848 domain-containing protein [Microaerobacter geothermalis]